RSVQAPWASAHTPSPRLASAVSAVLFTVKVRPGMGVTACGRSFTLGRVVLNARALPVERSAATAAWKSTASTQPSPLMSPLGGAEQLALRACLVVQP